MKFHADFFATVLGHQLRAARRARGLTARQVASSIRSYGPIVSRTEQGHHRPSVAKLALHGAAVGLRFADLKVLLDASTSETGGGTP